METMKNFLQVSRAIACKTVDEADFSKNLTCRRSGFFLLGMIEADLFFAKLGRGDLNLHVQTNLF